MGMTMDMVSRWLAPALLAAGIGSAALLPAPARAQDDPLTRVIVDVADVVLRGGVPYYRYGNYGYDDRLIVQRDRYGRLVYYRLVPARVGPPYGNAWSYRNNAPTARRVRCNRDGNCTVSYYDPRYDRRYDGHYRDGHHQRGHRGHHDGRRWADD